MDIFERKKQLRDEYDKRKKKLEAEFKAEIVKERKKKNNVLLKLLEEVAKIEDGLNVFEDKNHALLIGLLVEKIEDKDKYIATGKKILNKIKASEEKRREENREKRRARKELKAEVKVGEKNATNE